MRQRTGKKILTVSQMRQFECPKWDNSQGKPVINGKLTANLKEMTGQKTEKTKKTPSFFLN